MGPRDWDGTWREGGREGGKEGGRKQEDIIRESVDSLCRDGAGPPIVCVHWKSVLTRERSCSKPFWTPSYPIPTFLYPMIPSR